MEEKLKKVPKLRFKDENGEDFPAWEEKHIYELCRHHGGSALEKYVTESGKFKFISIGNYSKDGKYIDNGQRIDANHKSKSKILSKNDLVMVLNDKTCSGELIGATIVIERNNEYIYNQRSERIICNENVLPIFMWILLNSEKVRKRIAHLAQGGTQIYVNFSTVNNMAIQLPTLPEQTRIADFFTKLDSYIEQQELEVEKLKEQKKGFMQKIFSQEIRFKDENGEEFPAWEEKKLGEVCDFVNGKAHEKYISKDGSYILVNSKFISTEGKSLKYSSHNLCPLEKNMIAMVMSDVPNGKALAKCMIIQTNNIYALNQRICGLRPYSSINSIFLMYQLNRNSYFLKFDDGVSQTNLKKNDILACIIKLATVQEQTRIADFFTKLDEQIEVEQAILEKWKLLKKGFLQQMFI